MNHSSAWPPSTPTAAPTAICRANSPTIWAIAWPESPPAVSRLAISAMPTGSLAPDSPSRMVPLRPDTSRWPSTEKTTAGSVGATAVATRTEAYHSRPTARCRKRATPTVVRKVPAMPTRAMGRAASRKRSRPIPIPPSNRMKISATVTSRSTVCSGGVCRSGKILRAMAAAASIRAGAGTRSHCVSRLDSTAVTTTAAITSSSRAKLWASDTALSRSGLRTAVSLPTRLPGAPRAMHATGETGHPAGTHGRADRVRIGSGRRRYGREPPDMAHREPVTSTEEPTIGKLVVDASRDVSALIRNEIELAKSELKVSVRAGGIGIGLFAAAGFLLVLAVIMISVAFAYFLTLWFDWDLAYSFLIVFGVYLLLAALLGFIGFRSVKKVG